MPLRTPEEAINQAMQIIEEERLMNLQLETNGGKSILIVCSPAGELQYIRTIKHKMTEQTYRVIDLNEVLIEFVDRNRSDLPELFSLLKSSVNQIFHAPAGEESDDLFSLIIAKITACYAESKIPVLINSGMLYGANIENIKIMEHRAVMKSRLPLIILYPGSVADDKLLFLNYRHASKYRCMIIE